MQHTTRRPLTLFPGASTSGVILLDDKALIIPAKVTIHTKYHSLLSSEQSEPRLKAVQATHNPKLADGKKIVKGLFTIEFSPHSDPNPPEGNPVMLGAAPRRLSNENL